MKRLSQFLSVLDIADICSVARSTVSYWIAKKSLPAHRNGNKHMVSAEDLVLFLKSEGQPVPRDLLEHVGGVYSQPFRPFKRCWEYYANEPHGTKCRDCSVFNYQVNECFTARHNHNVQCRIDCHECQYFSEYYVPRIAFIHQLKKPAAVYKDLFLWSGNRAWADLCGVNVEKLIGAGIEEFIHPDSLKSVISYNKMRVQGDQTVPDRFRVAFINQSDGKIEVYLTISSLINPPGTWLAVAEEHGMLFRSVGTLSTTDQGNRDDKK